MEAGQRRSKRKPLSDCTNTLHNRRKNPSSSSKIPKSQTLIKPPKPFSSVANIVNNKQICSSPISNTSTGSNNYQNIPSIPRSPEPPAPPTPLSDAGGIDGKKSRHSADQIQRHDAPATRKDKGKMVADAPIIQSPASLTPNSLQISSSAAPGHCFRSETQSVRNENLHTQTLKDKGKTIVDDPVIESPSSWTLNLLTQTLKDKGKAIVDDSVIESPSSWTSNLQTQALKDKGKAIVDDPAIESPSSWTSKYLHSSSLFTSDDSLSKTSAVYSQELLVQKRKDTGKMVLETHSTEASEPSTPHAPHASFAASGTRERPLTVYTHKRAQQGRKLAAGRKISESLTCPPDQRIKKKGLDLDYDRGGSNPGSNTDPLPMRKKKRSREKYDDSMNVLPKEEVEKLRAMYADIDAFELPEEVASESELE